MCLLKTKIMEEGFQNLLNSKSGESLHDSAQAYVENKASTRKEIISSLYCQQGWSTCWCSVYWRTWWQTFQDRVWYFNLFWRNKAQAPRPHPVLHGPTRELTQQEALCACLLHAKVALSLSKRKENHYQVDSQFCRSRMCGEVILFPPPAWPKRMWNNLMAD